MSPKKQKVPKKPGREMTSEELLKFVFPKKSTREMLKRLARESEQPKRRKRACRAAQYGPRAVNRRRKDVLVATPTAT